VNDLIETQVPPALEFKKRIVLDAKRVAETNLTFPEEAFFDYVTELLSSSGYLDNIEECPYRNTKKGLRIDGYSWNELERTFTGIITDFDGDELELSTLTNTQIQDTGKKVVRYFTQSTNPKFFNGLEVTDPGRICADYLNSYLDDIIKFRVVIASDKILSTRVKKLQIDNILNKETTIEVWDLERLRDLELSGEETEDFEVDATVMGEGIKVIPANETEGVRSYLGIMPGQLLSAIYHEHGQRLLESNVRTFLDFRAGTNRGMRKSLATEPDRFFAYNNGITVTATDIDTSIADGQMVITRLQNMQIVNGGQTTAAIYFSPRDKGAVKSSSGDIAFKDIDLSKVYVQMKLSVISSKDTADEMKANIATYANSQNSIQQSDLVSNHPFHLRIEKLSRSQTMPGGELGLPTKWFYERARGQYSTKMRALKGNALTRFQTEFPKSQVFSKTDMAKYENTWRMKPHLVKKGAQANLKVLGAEIVREFDANEAKFEVSFYRDLIAKMILFRAADKAILTSAWYREESGLKAEAVTYTLGLIRNSLVSEGRDINLGRIYSSQDVSSGFLQEIVGIAKTVRNKIADQNFRDGVVNPSEFCKMEKGWHKIQCIDIDTSVFSKLDVSEKEELKSKKADDTEANKVSSVLSVFEQIGEIGQLEWELISDYFLSKDYPATHQNVSIPRACIAIKTHGRIPSDKQLKLALAVRSLAYNEGFEFAE
jgi:hypothetical protein